jgi:hypothetical protein
MTGSLKYSLRAYGCMKEKIYLKGVDGGTTLCKVNCVKFMLENNFSRLNKKADPMEVATPWDQLLVRRFWVN